MNIITILLIVGFILFIIYGNTSENFIGITVYVVWAIDNSKVNPNKFVGVAFTKSGAKRLIQDDQTSRWTELSGNQWRTEWRYDPVSLEI